MNKFEDFLKHGVRLRMMTLFCVMLTVAYCISMVAFILSKESEARAEKMKVYEDDLAVFEFFDANWDDWVESNGIEAVEAAYGKRPELPVMPGVQFDVLFEGFSHIFLVMMLSSFVCFMMSAMSRTLIGMHGLLSEVTDALNDPDGEVQESSEVDLSMPNES